MVAARGGRSAGSPRVLLDRLRKRAEARSAQTAAAPGPTSPLAAAAETTGCFNRATAAFLADLDDLLARRPRPRVAVLGEDTPEGVHRVIRRAYRSARVFRIDPALDPSERHARLGARGRFDAIVWEPSEEQPTVRLVEDLLFHLKKGGALLLRYRQPPRRSGDEGAHPHARELTAQLLARMGEDSQDAGTLSRAVGRVVTGRLHVLVGNRTVGLAKLREDEADRVLSLRAGRSGQVLVRQPPIRFESRCELHESKDGRAADMNEWYDVPGMSLREYHDVTCAPRQVVVQRNLLLPDTYRHNQAARLKNRFTQELGPRFARVPAKVADAKPLEGTYFYLDTEWPGHFGHVMTEQLSRLWALPAAREAHPEVKALLSRRRRRPGLTSYERGIFAAAGLAEQDIVCVDSPVRVERLLAATPMFSAPAYVHPDLAEVWSRTGDTLVAAAPQRRYPRRIFCSRSQERRACHNRRDVEALFAAAGFDVVLPEELDIAEQARMYREADVVAGFAGSGLLGLMFAPSPKRVIMLSPESYTARNEYLICSVLGHRMDVVWSKSDIPQPPGGWDAKAVGSGFTFDFAREGVHLERILSSL